MRTKNNEGRRKADEMREITKEKVRHKSNWKPRQWGPENGPGYLKMKGAAPRAQKHELQTATVKSLGLV